MRRPLLSCVLFVLTGLVGFAQSGVIAQFSADSSSTASGVIDTVVGVSARGVSRTGLITVDTTTFASRGFDNGQGINPDEYLEFSLAASGNKLITVREVLIRFSRSENGPTRLALRASDDNFAFDLSSLTDIDEESGRFEITVPEDRIPPTGAVTFRLYGFLAADTNGVFALRPILNTDRTSITVSGDVDDALPVELTSFTATPATTGAQLEWSVASELNNDYFSLEVSRDAQNFEEVERLVGRGTTETEATYSYDYRAYTSGTYYFRLRQVDFDGTESFSQVVPLNVQGRKGFSVIGNATQSILSLEVEGARDFRIISLTGEVVQSTSSLSGLVDVDVSNLPSGMYLLTDGTTTTRFVR